MKSASRQWCFEFPLKKTCCFNSGLLSISRASFGNIRRASSPALHFSSPMHWKRSRRAHHHLWSQLWFGCCRSKHRPPDPLRPTYVAARNAAVPLSHSTATHKLLSAAVTLRLNQCQCFAKPENPHYEQQRYRVAATQFQALAYCILFLECI